MFLAILQKIDLNMIEAAKIDGATGWEIFWKITLPAIRSIILLNAVYTLVYLANSSSNGVIDLISRAMIKTRGYGYASSMAWMHSIVVLVLLGLIFLLLKNKPDQFLKNQKRKLKEQRRREREKRRWLADAEKRADA
jgi:ABC-type sugar transport system permease subunit